METKMRVNPAVISQSVEPETDRSILKLVMLGIVGIVSSFFAFYFFNKFLLTADYNFLLWSALIGIFLGVQVILNAFFIKKRSIAKTILFLEALAPLFLFSARIFSPVPSYSLLIAAALFFLFVSRGFSRGHNAVKNGLKIKFFEVAKIITSKFFTGFIIFLSILVYAHYFEWGNFNDNLGKGLTDYILSAAEPIVQIWFPKFSFNQTFGEFLEAAAKEQIQKANLNLNVQEGVPFNFDRLPAGIRIQLLNETSAGIRSSIEKILGPVNNNDSIKDSIYLALKKYVNNLSDQIKSFLGIIVAFMIFLIIKSIAIFFYWLVELIAFIFFKFLIAVNFARIGFESRSREFIVLT